MHSLLARIIAGRTDLVLDFVAAGGSATAADTGGTRLAQWCAYYGDVSALRSLLDRGETLEALGSDFGLNAAAFHGHWQLCQFLLEHGAPVGGVASPSGETPLHSALCTDDRVHHDAVVRVLLQAGADVNAATHAGVDTGAFMRDCRTRGERPLHRAAAFGSVETIQLLIDASADKEARDAHGDSALGWASWYRRPPEILRLLCFDTHQIHPHYRGMRAHLAGGPL